MKITIYELLGMFKDGKAPKKIKYKNDIYEYEDYDYFGVNRGYFFDRYNVLGKLNDEVEILEEEKKIPEKLGECAFVEGEIAYSWSKSEAILKTRINEIIDYLKS